jgi:hypothetical protein
MKILKVIAIITLVYYTQSVLSMESETQPARRVTFNPKSRTRLYDRWIEPGRDVITQDEYRQTVQSAIEENYDRNPRSQEEAYERARKLYQDEDLYGKKQGKNMESEELLFKQGLN